jgi:hypothetical protein
MMVKIIWKKKTHTQIIHQCMQIIRWLHERAKNTKGRVNFLQSSWDEHSVETETRVGKYLN